eukprot:283792-Pelagomonas_calceolata.AAC.6
MLWHPQSRNYAADKETRDAPHSALHVLAIVQWWETLECCRHKHKKRRQSQHDTASSSFLPIVIFCVA